MCAFSVFQLNAFEVLNRGSSACSSLVPLYPRLYLATHALPWYFPRCTVEGQARRQLAGRPVARAARRALTHPTK
jgi:hypothetical protein